MNEKKGLICLLIVTMLILCVPNVTAAPMNKSITTAGGAHITDLPAAQQPTTLTLTIPSKQAMANTWFDVYVHLTTTADGKGVPSAQINFQYRLSPNDRWAVYYSDTTDSSGNYNSQIRMRLSGECYFRVTFGGDYWYAPSISNEALVTII